MKVQKNDSVFFDKIDVAIIGGGPAGLGAAIGAKRSGAKNVVVFEQGPSIGHTRKGEGIREDDFVISQLGYEIYRENRISTLTHTRFFSPSAKSSFVTKNLKQVSVIDHGVFLRAIAKIATTEGVVIVSNTSVKDIEVANGQCSSLIIEQNQKEKRVQVATVVAAGSFDCPTYSFSKDDKQRVYSYIVKMLYKDLHIENANYLDVYSDTVDFFKGCIVFPYSRTEAEIAFSYFPQDKGLFGNAQSVITPEQAETLYFDMVRRNPVLQAIVQNASLDHKSIHRIPMVMRHADIQPPFPNLFLAGNRSSHISALLGYGVDSSLRMGLLQGRYIGEALRKDGTVDEKNSEQIATKLAKDPFTKNLKTSYSLTLPLRSTIAAIPNEVADFTWPLFSMFVEAQKEGLGV